MSKFFEKLLKQEGVVQPEADPLSNCLQYISPSVNWAFGVSGHGLPLGYSMVLYGPPKGGKSIICNGYIGQLHKEDPEAEVLYFNTEMRGELQQTASSLKLWGIDPNRLRTFDRNTPEGIFDFIEHDLAAGMQDDGKVKLVVIDSLNGIQGRRSMNADSVSQQQIGDEAMTIQVGLKRILPVLRKYRISLILTSHLRAELDQLEQMRGKKVKMAAAWATKHFAEFFAFVEPNQSKEGRVNLAGEEFLDKESVDFMNKAQGTGHKIRFKIMDSSVGVKNRTAEFTLDYQKGIVNIHEEIFTLGLNLGIITKPNNQTYQFKDKTWRGIVNILTAMKDNEEMCKEILAEVYRRDVK